jgi:hypothetical protein
MNGLAIHGLRRPFRPRLILPAYDNSQLRCSHLFNVPGAVRSG